MRRLLAGALLSLVVASGCTNTGANKDPEIPNELVSRSVQAMSLATLVGVEVGSVIAAPPDGFSTCPAVEQDGDSWTFDYSAEGCVPDSGAIADPMLGLIEVTVAEGSGAFLGSFTEVGVGDQLLSGTITGDTSSAGDLLQADLDLSSGVWLRGAATFELTAFLEITGTADEVSLFVDAATLSGAENPTLQIDVEDAITPREGLAACAVPAEGGMTIFRETHRADLTFSEDAHASGNVTAAFSDRDPTPVTVCTE